MKKGYEILLLDSLWSVDVLERVVGLQVAQLFGPACAYEGSLVIRKINVQQQQACTRDCGLFAVAYATEICYGREPEVAAFEQSKMKAHLLQCLEKGKLRRFPPACNETKRQRPPKSIEIHLPLYCYCSMPENYDDMIQCDRCDGWYHKSCVGIKDMTKRQVKQLNWLCIECTGGSRPCLPPNEQTHKKPQEFLPTYPAKKHMKQHMVAAGKVIDNGADNCSHSSTALSKDEYRGNVTSNMCMDTIQHLQLCVCNMGHGVSSWQLT